MVDCIPPDNKPKTAEVCPRESSAATGLNSVDILLAQAPKKTDQPVDADKSQAAPAPKFEQLPAGKQKTIEDEYNKKHKGEIPIGDATMDKSETISIRIRRMGGMHADGMMTYKKGSEFYDKVLKHIGGLKPGEVKLVAPFPEEPAQNIAPKNKKGG